MLRIKLILKKGWNIMKKFAKNTWKDARGFIKMSELCPQTVKNINKCFWTRKTITERWFSESWQFMERAYSLKDSILSFFKVSILHLLTVVLLINSKKISTAKNHWLTFQTLSHISIKRTKEQSLTKKWSKQQKNKISWFLQSITLQIFMLLKRLHFAKNILSTVCICQLRKICTW